MCDLEAQRTCCPVPKHIEHWPLDKLIPYPRNPRTRWDAQFAQIAVSIAEVGFNNPILVDTKAGIIVGHGRLLAARKLQLTEVPVIVLDHLRETQKRTYILADNQLALNAGWDDELLRVELAALQAEDFNVDLIGFDEEELQQASSTAISTLLKVTVDWNVPAASRVRAAEGKSLLPAWLVEEFQSRGVRFDAAGWPELRPINCISTGDRA